MLPAAVAAFILSYVAAAVAWLPNAVRPLILILLIGAAICDERILVRFINRA
jgi:hypothetical protein